MTVSQMIQISKVDCGSISGGDLRGLTVIYEQVFPPEERRPIKEVLDADNCHAWLARHENAVLGFAFAALLSDKETALLQYIGVNPIRQSSGVGTALLEAIECDLALLGAQAIVLEIEDPNRPGADFQLSRRQKFYERWGAEQLTCLSGYFMPDFTDPKERLRMLLLWRPLKDIAQPAGESLKLLLTHIVESEYSSVVSSEHLDDLHGMVSC